MRGPLSITARLALLFSAIAVAIFVALGAYLYQTLARQMAHRDDAELVAKVGQLRHVLAGLASPQAVARQPPALLDAMFGQDDFVLRVSGPDGAPLLRTSPSSAPSPAPLPDGASVPAARQASVADVRDWRPAGGGSGRVVSAVVLVGAGVPLQVVLARVGSDRLKVLRRYSADLLFALCLGALLATALGFAVARYSMRQLRSLVARANDINTHRLDTRLSLQDAPVELRELGLAFNAMLDRLEDGVQRLSGFAADLAHDLRTPLNTLMIATQVALAHPRSAEQYQLLLVSNAEEYERLGRMIDNTLFLARVDNAQLALQKVKLDLGAELRRIHDYFEMLADDAGVRLSVDATGVMLDVDPVLLQRAVGNLMSNALAHTPPGGVITLSARHGATSVELAVGNSGAGIALEHLPHIFERYYRADAARGAAAHSAGLGLAIVRAIMALHGGTVLAASTPGASTTFTLLFPPAA